MITKKHLILISNDDGIHAPGIKALWGAIKDHADVVVVAPSTEQSAVGLSTTLRHPLHIDKVFWDGEERPIWSVNGTPADCIKLALNVVLERKPDLVISGINRGTNYGKGILYSGTVAAAIEGTMQGIPALAFSCYEYHTKSDYNYAASHVMPILNHVMEHRLPSGTFLNVNFPEQQPGGIKGIRMTKQSTDWWSEAPERREHPSEGRTYYWMGAQLRRGETQNECESYWLKEGYIAAVPVHVGDLTDHNHIKTAAQEFNRLF